ncbi:carbohydrate deacetylase [soil metagenome]
MSEPRANSLLGYPDDARLLIINADDFGMCHSNNQATLEALLNGVVTSTTLMMPCPWSRSAIDILKAHPEIPFGVHLTLVSEFDGFRWGPLSSKNRVPTLIDETGCFFRNDQRDLLLPYAKIEEVELEYRAQIEAVLAAGLAPTHLDWHCIADGGREDIFTLTLSLAREYGLALRVHDRAHASRCHDLGLPVTDHDVLDSYSFNPADKAAGYTELLRSLPPGLTEWAVHPSLGNAESQGFEPTTWQIRRDDFDFFTAPSTKALLDEKGIITINYREAQKIWAY